MISVSIAGIGGQGSVLAARILAEAARTKGWQVRTAETTGMAQRGGNVTSHVRMGDGGEAVLSPLPATATDDVVIALEPGEGLRALPLLKPEGLVVAATSGMPPVTANVKEALYDPARMLTAIRAAGARMVVVDDVVLCEQLGSRKALNILMLATALAAVDDPVNESPARGRITLDDMRAAIPVCVRSRFVDMNLAAIDLAAHAYAGTTPS